MVELAGLIVGKGVDGEDATVIVASGDFSWPMPSSRRLGDMVVAAYHPRHGPAQLVSHDIAEVVKVFGAKLGTSPASIRYFPRALM